MRVTRGQAEGNREKIVAAAARLFRENGFDGVGIECHTGDAGAKGSDGPQTLDCMAQVTKWAKDHNKNALIFMGGSPGSYTTPDMTKQAYTYLWDKMTALGVDKTDANLIYYRQGARPGTQLPEDGNTLTSQVKWLIENVKP